MKVQVKHRFLHAVFTQRWEDDATVRMVIIRAAGEKAFCAGGDIRGTDSVRLCLGVAISANCAV